MNVVYYEHGATFRAEPEHGKPVTIEVVREKTDIRRRHQWGVRPRYEWRYVVRLKGSRGEFSHHWSFERACKMALSRAKRYEEAYSVPRGLAA